MAKAVRKNRRLKKTVRKTLGSLFLASAIAVAAIPVDNLQVQAVDSSIKVGVDIENCRIPIVADTETIYTTGDGMFQFAYVTTNDTSAGNKVAVILGYDGGRREGGILTIPNTVDAYLKYTETLGTAYGYCAVGKDGDFLFYELSTIVDKTDAFGNIIYENDLSRPILDELGQPTGLYEQKAVQEKIVEYKPCYYNDYAMWGNLDVSEFFYQSGTATVSGNTVPRYLPTTDSSKQRIQAATVRYIGNQRLMAGVGDQSGTWSIVPKSEGGLIDTPEEGIFRGEKAGNVTTLFVGSELSGIGDYAFYGCTNLSGITLENGLDTIGNYAFANCVNLENVNIDITAMLNKIGHHAFYNCRGLRSFTVPRQVTEIGDSAFEGCKNLQSIELCGEGKNVQLQKIGNNFLKNCEKLTSVTLPDSYEENDLDINMWEGCTNLQSITALNGKVNFVDNSASHDGFDRFMETVPESFYFEGLPSSNLNQYPLHNTAKTNKIAFKYLGQDVYEITVDGAIYQVNHNNELIRCEIPNTISDVVLPSTIGPCGITTIDSTSFQGSCALERITIPSSITAIAENAFRGCHNLQTVIFLEPVNIQSIGHDAFKTQDMQMDHQTLCSNKTLSQTPVLQFICPLESNSIPFMYATDPDSYFNIDTQQRSYIKCYSGWPTNLEVQYNKNTDKNELINYPTFAQLSQYSLSTYPYMNQEYVDAARQAVAKYTSQDQPAMRDSMTDGEWKIINAALELVLPDGVESIKADLFKINELSETTGIEKTIEAYGLQEIENEAFANCKNLTSIYLMGGTTSIGDYAFMNCNKLDTVFVPATTNHLGKRPFVGCSKLDHVNFPGNPYYTCDNSIIFEAMPSGKRVIEYLEGRVSGVVNANEFDGVSEIAPEAFKGTDVSYIDLRNSEVKIVPSEAFADTGKLSFVYLPRTWNTIEADAFRNSAIQYLEIPGDLGYIDNQAFNGHTNVLTMNCEEGSSARIFAEQNKNSVPAITWTDKEIEKYYTVRFWDADNNLLDTQTVKGGQDANPPTAPEREGYVHNGWNPDYHGINRDMDITAQYTTEDPNAHKHKVTFLDYDGKEIDVQMVADGADAKAPIDPSREGYSFLGWVPSITNVTSDIAPVAQYIAKDNRFTVRFFDYDGTTVLYTQLVDPGADAILPQSPTRADYTFTGWLPVPKAITKDTDTFAQYEKNGAGGTNGNGGTGGNGGTNGNGTNGGTNGNGTNGGTNGNGTNATTKLYTLTVKNGSGSGSYAAGSQPIVIANDPSSTQVFNNWTIDPADTKIASTVLTATVITMPEKNVTVTANYKAKPAGTVTGSGNSSSNGSSNRPNNYGTVTSGGTTVVIDKNGLSNTGVVSATVNGSSDNFTIKISESASASELAVRALMSEYGDISNIKYFPMDISLYDSTGKNMITDTTGLSISITIPLPDSMITYAGNNKVASVTSGKLEKLNAKFTTISGVACVTFTAEHFSPYVIYVDTNNLTAGTISDSTPKTGDGIHPKWFLSVGLAFISLVLFMQKDRRKVKAARA